MLKKFRYQHFFKTRNLFYFSQNDPEKKKVDPLQNNKSDQKEGRKKLSFHERMELRIIVRFFFFFLIFFFFQKQITGSGKI